MSKIPLKIKKEIHERVWARADKVVWIRLGDQEKSRQYEEWIRDPLVGGVLGQFIDSRNVRVYLKDSVMKSYSRERINETSAAFAALSLNENDSRLKFIKPHGIVFFDKKCVCWGPAKDWKSIVLSVFERSHRNPPAVPHAAIFLGPLGKMAQRSEQRLVEEVAHRLGLEFVIWEDFLQKV